MKGLLERTSVAFIHTSSPFPNGFPSSASYGSFEVFSSLWSFSFFLFFSLWLVPRSGGGKGGEGLETKKKKSLPSSSVYDVDDDDDDVF
ncbi:hypothetical protein IE53DRAFT_214067 [Violaceomyces palustris]|uniref:Uncharacterized protein n=1 Tax=Violaceomyces palustris TaxID=1673888 RepID=A0ACD0NQK8_9BASI|nr:hypothetical protein IE53DRAFT_214067 [Violaceomyces palustris]